MLTQAKSIMSADYIYRDFGIIVSLLASVLAISVPPTEAKSAQADYI
jgi:hypothetical protein